MADLEHARSMLRMAHKDFNALLGMQNNPLLADEIFGFQVQQAVEKSLKAWLRARQFDFAISNPALNLAPYGCWTLREKAAQRRLALR